jgi:8-oxo-dGTP pyrophosphatase MutT (NUDIX family)
MNKKALLIPYNSQGEIFIQDRRGHKPPPWGFFGGGIAVGETSLQAVIRETKEELDLDLLESDLEYLGEFPTKFYDQVNKRDLYLYRTDQVEFTVLEGTGGRWVTFAAAAELMHEGEKIEFLRLAIEAL